MPLLKSFSLVMFLRSLVKAASSLSLTNVVDERFFSRIMSKIRFHASGSRNPCVIQPRQ